MNSCHPFFKILFCNGFVIMFFLNKIGSIFTNTALGIDANSSATGGYLVGVGYQALKANT
jgi:hypothetical protein